MLTKGMSPIEDQFSATHIAHDELIASHVKPYIGDADWQVLTGNLGRIAEDPQPALLARVFTGISRIVKPADKGRWISLDGAAGPGRNQLPLLVKDWTPARLLRVWTLMHIPPLEQAAYVQLIERLFLYGEMEELVALYSALPVFYYPEAWRHRCTEGIRSNIGPVREAIMADNPYAAAYLDEGAWNQLVLKGFFTEADMQRIVGLEKRNNARLASALVDYAHELHAAKRTISPHLWLLVAPFMDERAYSLMRNILEEHPDTGTSRAIAVAFHRSDYAPAKALLRENSELTDLLNTAG